MNEKNSFVIVQSSGFATNPKKQQIHVCVCTFVNEFCHNNTCNNDLHRLTQPFNQEHE